MLLIIILITWLKFFKFLVKSCFWSYNSHKLIKCLISTTIKLRIKLIVDITTPIKLGIKLILIKLIIDVTTSIELGIKLILIKLIIDVTTPIK